jgi:hypothetical protein
MKRVLLGLAMLLVLVGCAKPYMQISYSLPLEDKTSGLPVYLEIKDNRSDREIVTAAVKARDLFPGVQQVFDLSTVKPDGGVNNYIDADVPTAFFEAFKARIEGQGLSLLKGTDTINPTLVIEVQRMLLDAEGRMLTAHIEYQARFFRGGKEFRKETISGASEKFYVVGEDTAEQTLGEAFTSAINALDLTPILQ